MVVEIGAGEVIGNVAVSKQELATSRAMTTATAAAVCGPLEPSGRSDGVWAFEEMLMISGGYARGRCSRAALTGASQRGYGRAPDEDVLLVAVRLPVSELDLLAALLDAILSHAGAMGRIRERSDSVGGGRCTRGVT